MGFNTTLVIMNDALDQIEKDPELGKKLARAVSKASLSVPVDVSAGNHCNAMTVIESHHADQYSFVAVGRNDGINFGTVWPEYRNGVKGDDDHLQKVALVRALAAKLGYGIMKKRVHKK